MKLGSWRWTAPLVAAFSLASPSAGSAQNVIVQDDPWGQGGLLTSAMSDVFGAGSFQNYGYSGLNASTIFTPGNTFVYLEGGSTTDAAYAGFLTENAGLIRDWVAGGGRLYLNAATAGLAVTTPFGTVQGFGQFEAKVGTTTEGSLAIGGDLGFGDAGDSFWSGNFFSHGTVTGGGLALLRGLQGGGSVLSQLAYGAGMVFTGTLTNPQWWDPDPESSYLQRNILCYASGACASVPEPGLLILLSTGLVGLTATRRRRERERSG